MSIREEIRERITAKMYMAHPRRVPRIIQNALNGKLALQHPQSYAKVPHNPGSNPGHNPGILGRIRGVKTIPGSIVGPKTLRAGNHLGPGRMGHTRPEPSVRPRARYPEQVNTVQWEFTKPAYVASKPLSKGSVNQHIHSVGQDNMQKRHFIMNSSTENKAATI